MEFSYGYFIWHRIYSLYSFLEFQFLFQGYLFEDIFIFSWRQPFLIEIEIGIPITIGGLGFFFFFFCLKDNLGCVGLMRGGVVLLVMDYYGLVVIGFRRFLWGYLLLCWVLFSLWFPWVPITMGSKSCGFGKGVGQVYFN